LFLEGISTILSAGEIHDLFDNEDLEEIHIALQRTAVRSGIPDTKAAIFKYFMQRVRKKLHLVISTSPVGHDFRQNCRLYPSLINCCTIDWYDKWPLDALESVAVSFLELMEFDIVKVDDKKALKKSLAKTFVEVHKSVEEETKVFYEQMQRRFYTTPTSYIEFVRLFLNKFHEKASKFNLNRDRLKTGLLKLAESNNLVGVMQAELIQLGPQLEQKSKVHMLAYN
jgi:dynein heavy chain